MNLQLILHTNPLTSAQFVLISTATGELQKEQVHILASLMHSQSVLNLEQVKQLRRLCDKVLYHAQKDEEIN